MNTNLLLVSLAPVVILLTYMWLRDKYEKEPWSMLLKALALGSFSVIPILFVERFLSSFLIYFSGYSAAFWNAFVVAAFSEELFKFLFLFILIWRSREFNEKFDGIVYAVFVSLGFAAVENIMYVFQHGYGVALSRAITSVPAHFLFGVSMGYFFGMARFYPRQKKKYLALSLLIPIALHGVYDFILMAESPILLIGFIPFIVWMWIFGMRRMKQLSDTSVFRFDYRSKDDIFKPT